MKLAFHIFWKDTRYLWRELAVSLALLIAYGWSVQRQWAETTYKAVLATGLSAFAGGFFATGFWTRMLIVLLPISWLFAVVRAIQSDSLVGNRQFWLTRPYDWRQVLAAKCLFVLAFVNLPLLILDLYLLARAGFAPTHYIIGLLWMQLLILVTLVLPISALATITATVVQLLLAVFVIVLYLTGSSYVSAGFPASQFTSTDPLGAILLIATPVVVIGLQYVRRRTAMSRSLILVLMAALVLITLLTPYQTLISRQYPAPKAGEQSPIELKLGKNLGTWNDFRNPDSKRVGITLPLTISRTDPNFILILRGSRVEVEGPNARSWDAGWASMNSMQVLPGPGFTSVSFAMPTSLYQQLRDSDTRIRVTLAFTYFRDANQRAFVVPEGTFALPDGALCSAPDVNRSRTYGDRRALTCLSPLHRPTSLYMTLKLNQSTCAIPEDATPVPDDATGGDWIYDSESLAEFGISPISQFELAPFAFFNLSHPHDLASNAHPNSALSRALLTIDNSSQMHGLCPGTPITLSNPQRVGDMQITQQFENVHLPDKDGPPLGRPILE